jgi:hypothetical protein
VETAYCVLRATRAARDQTVWGGLVPSGLEGWLEGLREKGRYVYYIASVEPAQRFR